MNALALRLSSEHDPNKRGLRALYSSSYYYALYINLIMDLYQFYGQRIAANGTVKK